MSKFVILSVRIWTALTPLQVTTSLVKETVSGRKNTSPQNHYKILQLYGVGALKVACVGLQCVGFNSQLYQGLLQEAARCNRTRPWQLDWSPSGSSSDVTAVASEADNLQSLGSGL